MRKIRLKRVRLKKAKIKKKKRWGAFFLGLGIDKVLDKKPQKFNLNLLL